MSRSVAIVTGASSGIGLALTTLLLERDWKVVIGDLRAPDPGAIPLKHRDNWLFIQTDVSSFEQQTKLFSEAFQWGGQRLDLLAANAGMMDSQELYEQTPTPPTVPMDTKVFRVNTEAAVQGLYLFTHYARRNKTPGGKVVFTSSSVALYGQDSLPLYTSAKLALVGLTMAASKRYISECITVNVLCPSMISTGMAPTKVWELWPKEHITPMSTAMKAYEMILDNDQMTGQVLELSQDTVYARENRWSYPSDSQRWVAEESPALMRMALNK